MSIYGRHTQVKYLLKALMFSTCKKNIIIYSQVRFQLYQSHSLTVTGLKSGKKSKYWVSVGLLETSMWTLNQSFRFKIFHNQRLHIECISNTVWNFSRLTISKLQGKICEKCLKRVTRVGVMVLTHRLNVYLKPLFLAHVKMT